jgi:hypothetical protein
VEGPYGEDEDEVQHVERVLEQIVNLQLQELANIPEAIQRGLRQAAAELLLLKPFMEKKPVKACSYPLPTQSSQAGTNAVEHFRTPKQHMQRIGSSPSPFFKVNLTLTLQRLLIPIASIATARGHMPRSRRRCESSRVVCRGTRPIAMSRAARVEHHTAVQTLKASKILLPLREYSSLCGSAGGWSDAGQSPHLPIHLVWNGPFEDLLLQLPEDGACEPRVRARCVRGADALTPKPIGEILET